MKPVLNDVLQDLCTTPGPSGFERDIAQKAKAYLSPVSDSLTVDMSATSSPASTVRTPR